jgi:hypothetical protein
MPRYSYSVSFKAPDQETAQGLAEIIRGFLNGSVAIDHDGEALALSDEFITGAVVHSLDALTN